MNRKKEKNYKVDVIIIADIKYDIVETLAVLSEGSKGWNKELNFVSWNDRDRNMISGNGQRSMTRCVKVLRLHYLNCRL